LCPGWNSRRGFVFLPWNESAFCRVHVARCGLDVRLCPISVLFIQKKSQPKKLTLEVPGFIPSGIHQRTHQGSNHYSNQDQVLNGYYEVSVVQLKVNHNSNGLKVSP